MASDSERRKDFLAPPPLDVVPPWRSHIVGSGQNLLALQFQYIVTKHLQIAVKHLERSHQLIH